MPTSKTARAHIRLYILRDDGTEAPVEDVSELIEYTSEKRAIKEFVKLIAKYCAKHKIEESLRFNAELVDGTHLIFRVSRP